MRSVILASLALSLLAACGDPIAEQAAFEHRHDPERADTMLAVGFQPGSSMLDAAQVSDLQSMVAAGRHAQRDEFVVVTDGSGGNSQRMHAEKVKQSLSAAGARWVGTALEPAMAMGPDSVVVVRSEYRIGMRNCPNYSPAGQWNPNESAEPGLGCADAYNMGQMLARPRDAVVARNAGYADATVNAAAIQRYREGKVRTAGASGTGAAATINLVGGGGGESSSGAGGGASAAPSSGSTY